MSGTERKSPALPDGLMERTYAWRKIGAGRGAPSIFFWQIGGFQ